MKLIIKTLFKKKLSLKDQGSFLKMLGELIQNGFSFQESIVVLVNFNNLKLKQEYAQKIDSVDEFQTYLKFLKFSDLIINQIVMSFSHGNLSTALIENGELLVQTADQKKKLRGLLAYPVIIFISLIGMIGLVKFKLMPELSLVSDVSTSYIDYLVMTMLGLFLSLASLMGFSFIYIKRADELKRIEIINRLPFFGNLSGLFYEYLFCFQAAVLLKNDYNLNKITELIRSNKQNNFIKMLCTELMENLNKGSNLETFINSKPVLPKETVLIIKKGKSLIDKGNQFELLAKIKYRELIERINTALNKVQPILFLIIGIFIVTIYLSVLMPIYSMMENM